MNWSSLLPKIILPLISSSFNIQYMQCSAKLWSAVIKASSACPCSWHLLANLAFSCIIFCLSDTMTSKVSFLPFSFPHLFFFLQCETQTSNSIRGSQGKYQGIYIIFLYLSEWTPELFSFSSSEVAKINILLVPLFAQEPEGKPSEGVALQQKDKAVMSWEVMAW